jgi:antitoxin ParD1/3/4
MKDVPIIGNLPSMKKNTSISLGQHFDEFLRKEVNSGRYKTASEVVRDGLRMLEVKREREEALREAIEEGRKSGYIENFDMDAFLLELEKKYG